MIKNINELLFFDNMALHYLAAESPPRLLARIFHAVDPRLSGSLLGVLDVKKREILHALMSEEPEPDEVKKAEALDGLRLIARGLIERGFIEKRGRHFYGSAAK